MVIEDLQDEHTAKLLAQANLHRLRRQWDDAIHCCMQALYHAPENWRAHALLGDIYADQNRSEEAIQWYCMTLDMRPESQSVREKLSRLVTTRRREIMREIDSTHDDPDLHRGGQASGLFDRISTLWRTDNSRRNVLIAGLLIGIVAIALTPVWNDRHDRPVAAPVFAAGPSPTNPTLFLQPVTSPSQQQQPAGQTVTSVPAQPSPPSTGSSATAPPDPATSAVPIRDPDDQQLTDSLQQDPGLRASGITVTDAQLDPASSSMTVTLVCSSQAGESTQQRVLLSALTTARAALARPAATYVGQCMVRCLTAPASGSPATLTFQGTVPRAGLSNLTAQSDLSKMTPQQLSGVFTSVWWSPSAAQ